MKLIFYAIAFTTAAAFADSDAYLADKWIKKIVGNQQSIVIHGATRDGQVCSLQLGEDSVKVSIDGTDTNVEVQIHGPNAKPDYTGYSPSMAYFSEGLGKSWIGIYKRPITDTLYFVETSSPLLYACMIDCEAALGKGICSSDQNPWKLKQK